MAGGLNKYAIAIGVGLVCFLNPSAVLHASQVFNSWLENVRAEAGKIGVSEATLDRAFKDLHLNSRVIELDRRQPEFTLTFEQYVNRVVPGSRVQKGKEKYREHRKLLQKVGKEYGVQPRFIVALWGIETDFGRVSGGFPVIGSLVTLAYDGRRSKYFRKELMNALRILEEGHILPENMMGSWAGAMGQNQFMPSSFLRFATDYDGDGRRDIWKTKADIFASTANYLSESGWRGSITWGRKVKLMANLKKALIGLRVKKTIDDWQRLGVRRKDGEDLPKQKILASILVYGTGPGARAFMVYDNFRTILKWNRSNYFALAVGLLSDGLRGE